MTKQTKTSKKTAARVPIQLEVMGWMLGGTTANTNRALVAAREAFKRFGDDSADRIDVMGAFDNYVLATAPTHSAIVEKAIATDPGNLKGELICAFSGPAYLAGM